MKTVQDRNENKNSQIAFDSSDWDSIKNCLEVCKCYEFPFFGSNEKGETVMMEDYDDTTLKVRTFQSNDWVRENYYNVADFTIEEMYSR